MGVCVDFWPSIQQLPHSQYSLAMFFDHLNKVLYGVARVK